MNTAAVVGLESSTYPQLQHPACDIFEERSASPTTQEVLAPWSSRVTFSQRGVAFRCRCGIRHVCTVELVTVPGMRQLGEQKNSAGSGLSAHSPPANGSTIARMASNLGEVFSRLRADVA